MLAAVFLAGQEDGGASQRQVCLEGGRVAAGIVPGRLRVKEIQRELRKSP